MKIADDNTDAEQSRSKLSLFDGKVFILTSHGTFSAAMDFATIFSDNNWAQIIGEVPGNSPTSCGWCTDWETTDNGHIRFKTTYAKDYRPDKSKDGTRLIPDVQVPAKDALNKVYEIIKNNK